MKYPGLVEAIEAAGNVVKYMTAYVRLEHGWTMERATTTPPKPRGPRRTWAEKQAANRAAKEARLAARLHKQATRPLMVHKRRGQHAAEDTSPYHIARARAAYCDEFIKTGVLNPELAAKLRAYATDYRKKRKEVTYGKTSPAADPTDAPTVGGQSPRRP